MGLAKIRSDVLQSPLRIRPGESLQTPSKSDGECPMVIEACYENYLHLYAMLAVFAEQRGDDPTDALGPAPRELEGAF
jgi:hypothetical protein